MNRKMIRIANVKISFRRRSGSLRALSAACSMARPRLRWQRLDLGDPAGGLDLGAGRGGEGMSDHGDLAVPVAVTEDLDRLARRFDQASLDQTLQRDRLIALD